MRTILLIAIATTIFTGCGPTADISSEILAKREMILLNEEPDGALGVVEAKEAIKAGENIVLIGRIGAGEHSPWESGKASFMVADPAELIEAGVDHAHAEGHDHANCPYCNKGKKVTDALAIVQIVDDNGKVLPIDARELLNVDEDQLVVVKGKGQIDELGYLVVSAEGIYVRR
jgi:hypothetical protein